MKKIWFPLIIGLFSYVNLSLADWDRNYIGVNFLGFPTSTAEINTDLALLAPRFGYIRTYNSLFGPTSPENQVVPLVNAFNLANPGTTMKVAIGVALTPGDPTASKTELDQAILNAKTYPTAVNAVVVGNEDLGNVSEADLIGYINYAKTQLSGTAVKVTTCQTWGVLAGHPNLVNAVDYVLANIYPYWDGPGYTGGNAATAGAWKSWPGNVRELENAIERAVMVGKSRQIRPGDLPVFSAPAAAEEGRVLSLTEMARRYITQVLASERGHISKTAQVLRINRTTLYNKLKKYGLLS